MSIDEEGQIKEAAINYFKTLFTKDRKANEEAISSILEYIPKLVSR